jgi:8-oxo-dGTP pyrophosphatase MutT (NUDIX family)
MALLRDGAPGPEVLLLRRSRRTGFIPGAYVFPGGRVEESDCAQGILRWLHGLDPEAADERLGAPEDGPPALAFFAAAIRETFEEAGILLGYPTVPEPSSPALLRLRRQLLDGSRSFAQILGEWGGELDGRAMTYIGHWVTPLPEARRFDTRFFATVVPATCRVEPDGQELVEALWITPRQALTSNQRGSLPLVFPTIRTLEALADFSSAARAVASFRGRPIPRCLPHLTPTAEGIRIDLEL